MTDTVNVPREITAEMAFELESNFAECLPASEVHRANWAEAYRRMLAAAPPAPTVGEEEIAEALHDQFGPHTNVPHAAKAILALLAAVQPAPVVPDEVRELLSKATPGPWIVSKDPALWVTRDGDENGRGWRSNRDNDAAAVAAVMNWARSITDSGEG